MIDHEWIGLDDILLLQRLGFEIDVLDGNGQSVDKVRSFRCCEHGIEVKILGTVDGGSLAAIHENCCVEFRALIDGGSIRIRRKSE